MPTLMGVERAGLGLLHDMRARHNTHANILWSPQPPASLPPICACSRGCVCAPAGSSVNGVAAHDRDMKWPTASGQRFRVIGGGGASLDSAAGWHPEDGRAGAGLSETAKQAATSAAAGSAATAVGTPRYRGRAGRGGRESGQLECAQERAIGTKGSLALYKGLSL